MKQSNSEIQQLIRFCPGCGNYYVAFPCGRCEIAKRLNRSRAGLLKALNDAGVNNVDL